MSVHYYGYPSPYGIYPGYDERQFPFMPPPFGGGGQQSGFPGFPPFGGGQQGFPPFGGGGGQFPPFGGGGGGQQAGAPTTPPPSFTPQESPQLFAVDPGAIRGCLFRFTYVWLNNGNSFWFYPTFVGRTSVAGFRWRGFRWEYFGIDLNRIRSFRCS